MKKRLSILLVLALLALGCTPAALAAQPVDLTGKLVIVYTNDVHGYAITNLSGPSAGYAQVKQYKEDAAALEADPNRRWAHVRCLHGLGAAWARAADDGLPPAVCLETAKARTGLEWPKGIWFTAYAIPAELLSHPTWRTP